MDEDNFRSGLYARVVRYREAEESAERRLQEVQREVDRARGRREAAESLYQAEFGELQLALQQVEPQVLTEGTRVAKRSIGPFTSLSWDEAIEGVLREADDPLHVNEIWSRLENGGFVTSAMDPRRSVAAVAVRNPRLARSAPNTYVLVSREKRVSDNQ